MSNIDGDTPELVKYYDMVSDRQFEMGIRLVDMMRIKEGDAVLDIGCGTGRLALHVSNIIGLSGHIIGIDPSPNRVLLATEKMTSSSVRNAHFQVGQGEDLGGIPAGGFDHAYYCAVFHWINDKKAALRETYRVLKPGGKVGITSRSDGSASLVKGVTSRVLVKYSLEKSKGGSQWSSEKEMEALLSDAGFTDITARSITMRSYFQTPREFFLFMRASAFGQPSRIPEHLRAEVGQAMAAELEKRRTPSGIEIISKPLLVIATKSPLQ